VGIREKREILWKKNAGRGLDGESFLKAREAAKQGL